MTDLRERIQRQQDAASDLEGLLSALEYLHAQCAGLEAQGALIRVAHDLAAKLARSLDLAELPAPAHSPH